MLKIVFQKIILITIVFISLLTITNCKKEKETNYLENPVAIVYKNNTPYIINKNQELFDLSKYDTIVPYFGDILIVKKDNYFGYIKNNGEEITQFIYDEAYPFSEDKAVVSIDNQFYIISQSGTILYTFDEGISSQSFFTNGYLVVNRGEYQGYLKYNDEDNSFSYLIEEIKTSLSVENQTSDSEFSLLDANFKYAYCGNFEDGYAVVGNINEDGELKYTHIDEEGNRLYDLEWDFANNFSNGYAVVGNYTDYEVSVYCSNENRFDEEASTTVELMGYMYISPTGNYLGTESIDEVGNPIIIPNVYALANDYTDSVALVARLLFYVTSYNNRHDYDFSTNDFFYNYEFLDLNGQPLFGNAFQAQNNWGGNSIIYNNFFKLGDYYITTYYRSAWSVKYTPTNDLNWSDPFYEIKFDLKENTDNAYLLETFPWIQNYLNDFTTGKQEPLYVVDRVVNPYYLTDFKQSKYLDDKFVARAHTYSGMDDSCGLIAISIVDNNLQLSYIVAPLYENIIF